MAGGLGTRLRPLTHTGAKQLIPIANKPVLYYIIEDLKNAGIENIGVIVGYDKTRIDSIKNAVGDGSRWGVKITYIEQDAPRGIGHAVLISEDFMDKDDFVVYLGDNMLKEGIKDFVDEFRKSRYDASLVLSQHARPQKFGVAVLDKTGNIVDVEEKPQKPKSNLVITGIYIFKPVIFDVLKKTNISKRNELELTDSIRTLILSGRHKVSSHIVKGWWDDAGDVEAVLLANHMVLSDMENSEIEGNIEKNVKILGNVRIGKGTIVKNGTFIKGPTVIGENCIIGPNTYIGPYTAIGEGCTIEDGEIESSIVIGNAKISYPGKIVNSLIGRYSIINSSKNDVPKGQRFILGENSELRI